MDDLQFEKEDDNVVASCVTKNATQLQLKTTTTTTTTQLQTVLQKQTAQLQFEEEDSNVLASNVIKDNNVFAFQKRR